MATPTYDLISSTTLSTATATVSITGINSSPYTDYKDMIVVINGTMGTSGEKKASFTMNFGSGFYFVNMSGNGTTTKSTNGSGTSSIPMSEENSFDATEPCLVIINFFDFLATDKHKSGLMRTNRAGESAEACAWRYPSTSAIFRLDFSGDASYNAGTTFNIYGVAA